MKHIGLLVSDVYGRSKERIVTRSAASEEGGEQSPRLDRERMEKALAGPTFEIPSGLSPKEIRAFILKVAARHK